jgi:hypothetical protein
MYLTKIMENKRIMVLVIEHLTFILLHLYNFMTMNKIIDLEHQTFHLVIILLPLYKDLF